MRPLGDPYLGAIRQQHPDRNLQPLSRRVNDRNHPISPLRPAEDLQGDTMERMKRVEDLHLRSFRTQGIVGVGALIPMFIASLRPADSPRAGRAGCIRNTLSSCPSKCSARFSAASSRTASSELIVRGRFAFPQSAGPLQPPVSGQRGHTKQFLLSRGEPALTRLSLALGTVSVSAAVVRDGLVAATRTIIDMPAQSGCAAAGDSFQHFELLVIDWTSLTVQVTITLRSNDVGHLDGGPAHAGFCNLRERFNWVVGAMGIVSRRLLTDCRCVSDTCR
jgi:hypothetical protein